MIRRKESQISAETVAAVSILLDLFSDSEKESLKIKTGNTTVPLVEQMVGRWGEYVPVTTNVIAFKAKAARIKTVNQGGIHLLGILEKRNFFLDLLDPESYKEKITKKTTAKLMDKRLLDVDVSTGTLSKSLSRGAQGTSGMNKSYLFSKKGDELDRERLDNTSLNKGEAPVLRTETGDEDDTRGSDAQENSGDWMDKSERLDSMNVDRFGSPSIVAKFKSQTSGVPEEEFQLFDASINQSVDTASGQTLSVNRTFIEGLKRHGYNTTKERIILAEAINSIKNVDFTDVHEKIFEKFDVLFKRRKEICQSS